MKKLLLVTAITIFGAATVNAQDVKFGIKGGLNFATITGDNTSKDQIITAFNFGAMAEIKISEKFSFQPEVLYSGQGYDTGIDSEGIIALNYLNIPLIAKYYVTKRLSLEAGPQIGFLLSTKGGTQDYKDLFKTTDFGVNFGLGYKLDNGLNFGARYVLGLSNINDVGGMTNKNSVLQFTVGYFF
ncbi:porin family protein [uncultured Algibacter sp.]|uniref:porin family protein n=1 Tax=uncultured Algibacter sp. TaxID=298659 RepID=UPI003216C072